MKPLFTSLACLGLLAGCAGTPDAVPPTRHGTLVLKGPLVIPAQAATVRLQYGRVVAFNAVQEHDPFCVFELDTVAPVEQIVRPGRFAILRVARSVETIAGMPAPVRVRVGFGDDGGAPSHLYYKTHFRLHDSHQAVRALTCMSNQMAPGIPIMRHLTWGEIRATLGDIMTLEFPI